MVNDRSEETEYQAYDRCAATQKLKTKAAPKKRTGLDHYYSMMTFIIPIILFIIIFIIFGHITTQGGQQKQQQRQQQPALKIAFKPAELKKTTDRVVTAQVRT